MSELVIEIPNQIVLNLPEPSFIAGLATMNFIVGFVVCGADMRRHLRDTGEDLDLISIAMAGLTGFVLWPVVAIAPTYDSSSEKSENPKQKGGKR